MTEHLVEKRVVIASDPDTLARAVAERFIHRVRKRVDAGAIAHVSLTGGSMGGRVLAAARDIAGDVTWSKVHFWWSDERVLPAGSAERNETQARHALLDHIDIPADNIHAMAASDGGLQLQEAADSYAAELGRFASEDSAWPRFDVTFLGVGPDGHIASLFPDRPEIQILDRAVVPVTDSPKPPAIRLTMTRPVINSSQRVWMVMAGPDKAPALGLALAGASYTSVPAAGAKGRGRTVFFVDQAAAAQVPPELIDRDY
ncbi:MAG: 6-phosphogluconolactonase [Microbacterium sp.]|uniref:6-phosphogluconolactonase n=1 Tax=Microbacterium aquimaris TaxID=459816 RepID=UPI000C94391B|nr:6-phosphogluconolactonase [Microbacterium aquimaris]MAP64879.1 6-phosphogluconolactonase [Microbacterium sp.]MDZ8276151.1 6-phosphogluconolactonase [Microbacterium aquimaris]